MCTITQQWYETCCILLAATFLTADVFQLNQPNICVHTANRQQNTLISTTSGEKFNTIYNTDQKNKNNQVHLGPLRYTTYVHILYDLYNPPDYFGYY